MDLTPHRTTAVDRLPTYTPASDAEATLDDFLQVAADLYEAMAILTFDIQEHLDKWLQEHSDRSLQDQARSHGQKDKAEE